MFTLNCKGRLVTLSQPVVMGILNATPDSFYGNSRVPALEAAVQKAGELLANGAAMLDIGGQSTRPGLPQVDAGTEAARVIPIIKAIHQAYPDALLSVDTYYASVAQQAVEAGACIVNDISGGWLDEAMLRTVASLQVPYICMHMKGNPETMQHHAAYEDITREVLDYFIERIHACTRAGIHDVMVDPGFGFAKTHAHNLRLLHQLGMLAVLDKPILAGLSRKSTIYKTLGTTAEEALNGTTVLNTIALLNGAHILRVHDAKEAHEAILLVERYKKEAPVTI